MTTPNEWPQLDKPDTSAESRNAEFNAFMAGFAEQGITNMLTNGAAVLATPGSGTELIAGVNTLVNGIAGGMQKVAQLRQHNEQSENNRTEDDQSNSDERPNENAETKEDNEAKDTPDPKGNDEAVVREEAPSPDRGAAGGHDSGERGVRRGRDDGAGPSGGISL